MTHLSTPQRRILVTGLGGFTGRYLQAALQQCGWEVWGLGLQSAPPSVNPAHYLQVDLADSTALAQAVARAQPHAVIHLAAVAFVGHGDADAFYRVNLLGTRHLLAALAALPQPPARVMLVSSANVYGNQIEGMLDEATSPRPANDYAVSKLAMEYMAQLWITRLPIIIVRPFNYTGVGQTTDFLLPKIVDHFRRRAANIELGNLDVWRDFSDVRAVVNAYCRLLDAPSATGTIVNVCSGRSHSLRSILAMAEQITGHTLQVQVNPALVRANEVKNLLGNPAYLRMLVGTDWATPPLPDTLCWMLEAPAP